MEFTVYESWGYNNSFSLLSSNFLRSPIHGESFTLYNFLLDHIDRTLVSHSNLHSSTCPIRHLLWLSINGSGWMRPEKLLQCIKCGDNSFSLKYFCIFILFIHFWSSSLSLEVLRKSAKLPKYSLNQHSSYPSSITFSDCTLPPFSLCDPPF